MNIYVRFVPEIVDSEVKIPTGFGHDRFMSEVLSTAMRIWNESCEVTNGPGGYIEKFNESWGDKPYDEEYERMYSVGLDGILKAISRKHPCKHKNEKFYVELVGGAEAITFYDTGTGTVKCRLKKAG
jgi:hypothetical protein